MKSKLLIALLVIIFTGGGGAGWYFFLREAAPEVVLQKMQQAMLEMRSLHSETALAAEIDLSNLAPEDPDESLALFFPNEREITLNVLITGDHALDAEGLPTASQVIATLYTSPASLARLEAELRSIDKTSYFILNDIGLFLPLDVSAVQGTWYRADALKKLSEYEGRREEITGKPQKKPGR